MMKNATRVSLILAVCLAAPAISRANATTYRILDDGKSRVTFVSDAPLETMTGKTSKVTGTVTVDPADITKTKGSFKAPVVSLRTDNDLRDEHLQGDGWLDAKKHPNILFEITEVIPSKKGSVKLKKNKDTKVQVRGLFTAHGVTKPVIASGSVKWSDAVIHIKAKFTVTLEDHMISVPTIVRLKVANEIAVTVDLTGVAK